MMSPETAHAQTIYSANAVLNPGFENISSQWLISCVDSAVIGTVPRDNWQISCQDSNVGSSVGIDNSNVVTGLYSLRLDTSDNRTSYLHPGQQVDFGHIDVGQNPLNIPFTNFTNRPDSLNIWFNIHPKFAGYALFEVRLKANDTTEMDYFYKNPNVGISFDNVTSGEAGKPVKELVQPQPGLDQWVHLTRNIAQDWAAPLQLSNGTVLPGFKLGLKLDRLEFDVGFWSNSATSPWYGETVWIDDVNLFVDTTIQPPPPPPSNYYASYNFEDVQGNPVNNLVQWKLFNSTGQEVIGYNENSPTLMLEPYTVAAYYPGIIGQTPEPYLILRQRIVLNTTMTIPLEMIPQSTSPWSYVALNSTITGFKILQETPTFLQFGVTGNSAPYLILVKAQAAPVAIQRNADDPASLSWSYDSSLSVVRIPTGALGNFSIFTTTPISVPNFSFQDLTGASITSNISWNVFDSTGSALNAVPGELIPNGTYTLRTYYEGYAIYGNSLTSTATTVRLQMMPIGGGAYLAFNSTVNGVSILQNNSDALRFTAQGAGPTLIVVNVHGKPVSVQKDGEAVSNWSYDPATGTVAIQTSQPGTFDLAFTSQPSIPILYVGIAIGAIIAAALAIFALSRRTGNKKLEASSQPSQQAKSQRRPPSIGKSIPSTETAWK